MNVVKLTLKGLGVLVIVMIAIAIMRPTPSIPATAPTAAPAIQTATPTVTPAATTTPTVTPAATTTPTVTPAATTTPTVTATPTKAVSTTVTPWMDFLAWATPTSSSMSRLLGRIAGDAGASDVVALQSDSADLYRFATDADVWLRTHEPESCYANVHSDYTKMIAHLLDASRDLATGDVSVAALRQSATAMNDAAADANVISVETKNVRCE